MQIQSLIKRTGGTVVTLDGKDYKFQPDELDRHVCDVTDKKHIQRFLSIPEGFAIADDDEPVDADKAPDAAGTLAPDVDEEAEQAAVDEQWQDETPDEYRARLASEYEEAFGKAPHHKMKTDTIAAKLGYSDGESDGE